MKSIYKITLGELKKIFKGIGVYIMTGILLVAIVLFAVLYETQLDGGGLIESIINRGATVTVFDIIDGEADDIVGDNFASAIEIPGATDLLTPSGKFNDYFKMILLTDSLDELILNMMQDTGDDDPPSNPPSNPPSGNPLDELLPDNMVGMLKTASMIGATFTSDLSYAADVRERILSEVQYFKNEELFGRSYVGYIGELFIEFAKKWDDFTKLQVQTKQSEGYITAYNNYIASKAYPVVARPNFYLALLSEVLPLIDASNQVMALYNKISDYCEINVIRTKYLLYKSSGLFGVEEAATNLSNQLRRFSQRASNYTALLSNYATMMSDAYIFYNAVPNQMFASIDDALYYCVYKDFTRSENVEPGTIDLEKFMIEVEGLISNQTWDGQFFSGFNPSGANAVDRDEFENEHLYYAEVMKAPLQYLDESLTAPITAFVYSEHIEPYLEVLDECYELRQTIDSIVSDFRALSSEEKKAQASVLYASLKRHYNVYMSKVSTFNSLMQNLNLSNTVETLKYKDSELKTIYGNQLFGSKYSIRSTVTECKFFLETGEVGIDYATVNTLDAGYGYMNFAWVIVYVLILIFGIVIGAGQIAGEHSQGTMKLLLIRPHKRWQVMLGKLIATMIVTLAFFAFALLFTYLIGGIFWGFSGTTALLIFNSTTPIMVSPFTVMLIAYLLGYCEVFIYVLIALMVSTVFKSHAGAVSVSMLIYFLAMVLTTLLGQFAWYKYVVFNNSNLFSYFANGPSLNDMTFWFSFVVNIVYIAILMFASLFTFQKRDAV